MIRGLAACVLLSLSCQAMALSPATPCNGGVVWEDADGNGRRDAGEKPLVGIKVSDGVELVLTDAEGRYRLPVVDGRTTFVIKPAGYAFAGRDDGLPDFWRHVRTQAGPALKFGGIAPVVPQCRDFALTPVAAKGDELSVLLFADTQTKSLADVDYYLRDIVRSVDQPAALGLTLGDVVDDDLSLYPALNRATRELRTPWLHIAGNHDLDLDATSDEDSLLTFRNTYGPDTFAWEEAQAVFIGLDDVIYRPGQKPAYVGGLREQQFAFLQAYLPTVPKDRLLVLGVHIPLFEVEAGRETFRTADRERLFALLEDFPHVLLLSGHTHNQQHRWHGADAGWHGAKPLHEYNVGAACGAFWSGVKDAEGIPDARMSDGTPNGYAHLRVKQEGSYALAWHPARDPAHTQIGLHAPRVLRQGAYPAWGVYANVYMGAADSRVEYRVDEGQWQPMKRVVQGDPRVLVENLKDDLADALRGYDRSPEATPSSHLWRGALPTDLPVGEHRIQVRALPGSWHQNGPAQAETHYRLEQVATPVPPTPVN